MKQRFFIALSIFLLSLSSSANDQHIIDSLKVVIEDATHDSTKVNILLEIANLTYIKNPDTALNVCKQALKLAEHNNMIAEKAECYGWLGYLVRQKGEMNLALEYNFKALRIEEKIIKERSLDGLTLLNEAEIIAIKQNIAPTLNNIGLIYKIQGDILNSLKFYLKSLKVYEQIGNKNGIATCLNNIGLIYKDQGDIARSLEFYDKGLKILEEIGDKKGIATYLSNIGVIYSEQEDTPNALEFFYKSLKIQEEIGYKKGVANSLNNIASIYYHQGKIANALEYHDKSLKTREEIQDKSGIANSLNNIAYIYKNQGDPSVTSSKQESLNAGFKKALEFSNKSLKIREEIGDKSGIASSLNNIGEFYLEQGRLDDALENGTKGLLLARTIGSPRLISHSAGLLSKVAKAKGNHQKALEMYELHIQMRDSIKNEETQKATIRQQTKYEFEKTMLVKEQKEKEEARVLSEEISRRDNLQYSVVLICLLVIGVIVAMLGRLALPVRMAEGIIFFSFLILFEFLLVLADPYIDNWSGGAPGFKLLFNAGIAAFIFPLHSFFERKLKGKLVTK